MIAGMIAMRRQRIDRRKVPAWSAFRKRQIGMR
jgi:hypothetical protein